MGGRNVGDEVARLSCLNSLTSLHLDVCFSAQYKPDLRRVDVCRDIVELSSLLSKLVRLGLDITPLGALGRSISVDREQRIALCWCLAPLAASFVWPQLQKLTLPRAWLLADSASGDESAQGGPAGAMNSDAHGSATGQQLLAQLRERRPQLNSN